MASLVSTGLGSGLDIEGLVTKLMAVEKQSITKLAAKEASYQAKITAYGTLKGALSTFQTSVSALNSSSAFNTQKATLADSSVASVAASNSASSGTYSLEVSNLAQAHKIRTAATYTATTSTVGSGTLTIDFGKYSPSFSQNTAKATQTITISSGQNTLSGVRDAINAANAGVTASIVNDGGGYRLMLASNDTGASNALRIQATGSLSALAYDASGALSSSMTPTQTALDASFSLDGITMTSASNTVTNALDGVTLSLLKSNTGSPTTLSVSRDTSSVSTLVKNFVTAFNTLKTNLSSMTAYNATTKAAGSLQGDATALSIQSQLRNIFNTTLSNAGGGFTTLSDIGVNFKKDGTLTLNTTTLNTALADSTKDIATLFTTMGKPTDSLVSYTGGLATTKSGTYALNVTQLATQSRLTGNAALSGPTITAGSNDGLALEIDGKSISIALTAGTYTNATIAAELQSKINGALGTSGSSVEVTAGTAASLLGSVDVSAFTYPYTPSTGNNTLSVTVDGTSKTITLSTASSYASADTLASSLAEAINSEFGSGTVEVSVQDNALRIAARSAASVSVAADGSSTLSSDLFGTPTTSTGSELTITSKAYGQGSTLKITGGTAASTLFGTATRGSVAVNVAGTVGGVTALGFGQQLTVSSGNAAGLQVKVIGGSTGDRGSIKFDHGFADLLNTAINAMTASDGIITSRTDGLNKSIDALGDRSEVLALRMAQIEKRYRAQFNALDSTIASLQQTSSFLEKQLSALSSA